MSASAIRRAVSPAATPAPPVADSERQPRKPAAAEKLAEQPPVLAAAFCATPDAGKPVAPPPLDESVVSGSVAGSSMVGIATTAIASAMPLEAGAIVAPPAPSAHWFQLAQHPVIHWLVLASAPLVGLAIVVGVWSLVSLLRHKAPPPAVQETTSEKPTVEQTPTAETKPLPKALPARLDRRWLPDRTALIFSLRASRLTGQPQAEKLISQAGPLWRLSIGDLLDSLGIPRDRVQRLTWTATELSMWRDRSVVVIELTPDQDANSLAHSGEAADVGMAGVPCRRMAGAAWSKPFLIVDRQTIVTGHEELLRSLAQRNEAHLESAPLDRLLNSFAPDADAMLLVDLAAARAAHWNLPSALLDVWPAGKRQWHALWDIPDGLGCSLHWSDPMRSEVAFACEGETAADKVRSALDELMPAIKQLIPKQIESLQRSLQAGRLTAAAAAPYSILLDDGQTALQAAHWQIADGTVWLRLNWGRDPLAMAATLIDSLPAMRSDWLSAALVADEANNRHITAGLIGHAKAEGSFPPGAEGGAVLPPETRLSWIAAMLPYYGHADWHQRLEFGYPWNGPQNAPVTRRPLPEVTNPAIGPANTEAGFPVTHYVGVAGVGTDAGRLKADDPRAGMFGYGRSTRPEEITRGTANTIAVLGVTDRCGPWASGGDATVRPLTKAPYVNGPDGFGSGQPDGMVAGMADGSVRFISKNADPHVIEQLATIHGDGDVTVAALDPKPALPKPETQVASADRKLAKPQAEEQLKHGGDGATKKPAAPAIDVDARLAEKIPLLDLPPTPLGDVVDLLSAMGNVHIAFDPDALLEAGVSVRDPVTIQLNATTVGKALEAILSDRKLTYVAENGQVLVTSPPEYNETQRPLRYTVSDLTGHDAKATAGLADLIEKMVAPDSWQANGGSGTIKPDNGVLAVVQTGAVHYQIVNFCEKLRTARHMPTRSRMDPSTFALTTRTARARAALEHEVSVNFGQPTPLAEILLHLKKQADADIFIDWPTMQAAGLADDLKGTLKVTKQPLATALGALLEPLGLGYRAVDAQTIQVSTRKAIAGRLELEFYPVRSLLGKGQTASALVERIKSRVGGPSWSDAGGPGLIHFDPDSQSLIVLQSQPVHVAIEALLAEKGE
jgi:hypothetical protein